MNKMKKLAAVLLAMALLCGAGALAAGNVTIALQGQNGFEDYVSSMFVWDGRLLMTSWSAIYTWKPGDSGITEVEGYGELQQAIYEQRTDHGDGERYTLMLGETELELEGSESLSFDSAVIPMGDRLFRVASVYGEEGLTRSLMVELCIAEDGSISLGEVIDLGDALGVEYGDGYYGSRDMQNVCYDKGMLYALSYGESGREMLAVDIEAGEVETMTFDTESEVVSLAPFTEGKLLMVGVDYNTEPIETALLVYDIDSEEITSLGALPVQGWNPPTGIVYDEARGMVYYALGGSVWRMAISEEGLGEPEEFGDMPLEVYTDSTGVLLDTYYILASYEGVIGRDVETEKLPEQKLRVANYSYVEYLRQAYFPFTDAHPEYMVSVVNGGTSSSILQDMMNRSADTDIYTLGVSSDSTFRALMNRGFLAELGSSQALSEAAGAMYDSLKAVALKDGELYAVPVSTYMQSMTINKALLTEKLGYTQEDIPQDWLSLFALINDLAQTGKLEEYPEVSLFGPGYIQSDAKASLFYQMLGNYFVWLDADEANLARGSEVLLACCEALEAIDWSALGMPEDYDDSESSWEWDTQNILLQSDAIHPRYYYEEDFEPMVLALVPGEAPMLPMDVTVAFVNPFSAHREAAIEYLEMAFGLVDQGDRIAMMPDENEPILSPWYEENLKYYDESIASLEENLAVEDLDEESRDMLTQNLEEMKQYREEYEREGRWEISEADIARYRRYADKGVVTWNSIWSSGEETYSQAQQYLDGAITAQQLCAALEKTLQMQRLEGM